MYENEQSRINAVISYFFLGPIFLLAKTGTPLGESYVRTHAKRSSMIILSMFSALIIYILIRPYITWTLPGIGVDLRTLALITIIGVTLASLMRGAYRAYHGSLGGGIPENIPLSGVTYISSTQTIELEEDRIRILMSMIPLLGISITRRYSHPIMERGRIIGSAFFFFYIVSLIFSSEKGFFPFIILALGIFIFVFEGVYLILYQRWVSLSLLERLPSYREVEASLIAFIGEIREFFALTFGKTRTLTFRERYIEHIDKKETVSADIDYFMPAGLLGVPFWNLFGIPSLFIEKYRAYHGRVIEGLMITLIVAYFWFYAHTWTSPWLLMLLFPLSHILVYGNSKSDIYSPGIGLLRRVIEAIMNRKKPEKPEVQERFTYEVEKP